MSMSYNTNFYSPLQGQGGTLYHYTTNNIDQLNVVQQNNQWNQFNRFRPVFMNVAPPVQYPPIQYPSISPINFGQFAPQLPIFFNAPKPYYPFFPPFVDNNDEDEENNSEKIKLLSQTIADLTKKLDAVTSTTKSNTISVNQNTSTVAQNTQAVEENTQAVQQNTSTVAQNTQAVQQNTSTVAQNTQAVQQNTTAVKAATQAQNLDPIEKIYQTVLGRSSDAGGKAFWTEKFAAGASLEEITRGFYQSHEYKNKH